MKFQSEDKDSQDSKENNYEEMFRVALRQLLTLYTDFFLNCCKLLAIDYQRQLIKRKENGRACLELHCELINKRNSDVTRNILGAKMSLSSSDGYSCDERESLCKIVENDMSST